MGRVNTPELTDTARSFLEAGYHTGERPAFRKRCHVVLLKAQGRTSRDVGLITGMSDVSVNSWVRRYVDEGLDGLHTRAGRGRKPVLVKGQDDALVLEKVKSHRQRLGTAKAEWEKETGRSVGTTAFKSFLKSLVDDING